MLKKIFLLSPLFLSLTGCVRYAYYLSPLNGNTHNYKTIPLASDSLRKAIYADFSSSAGSANDMKDEVYMGNISIHQSHNLGHFQAYYGASLSMGSYVAKSYTMKTVGFVDTAMLNRQTGNKFFGAGGVLGGINIVVPAGRFSEWRALGVEASVQQEFGNYLRFRKSIPSSTVNAINNSGFYPSLALSSEIIGRARSTAVGFKMSMNFVFSKIYNDHPEVIRVSQNSITQTFLISNHRTTGYLQWTIGEGTIITMFGLNYRIR